MTNIAACSVLVTALVLALAPPASAQQRRDAPPDGPRLESVFIQGPVRMEGVRARLSVAQASLRGCPWAGVAAGASATLVMQVGDNGRVQGVRVGRGPTLPGVTVACLVARHRGLIFPTARGVGPLSIEARWGFYALAAGEGGWPGIPNRAPDPAPPQPPRRATHTGQAVLTALTADVAGSVERLRAEVLRRADELLHCYEARLDARGPFGGTLVLVLTFVPGAPLQRPASVARSAGSLRDAALETCVITRLRRAVFGVEPTTLRATVSLAFRPDQESGR